MLSDDQRRALAVIEHHIALIAHFIEGMNFQAFADDVRTLYAVTRCLEIISEASRKIPVEMKAKHPNVPWREIAGAGNVYRHDYEDVRARVIWQTSSEELNELRRAVAAELA
jgi:uncharacterized protein with HEPN domain